METATRSGGVLLGLALLLALGSRCNDLANEAGRLHAERTGDVSNPPAERLSPGELAPYSGPLTSACPGTDPGLQPPQGASLIMRRPYLQQLTERGVAVVWTSMSAAAARLSVQGPQGERIEVTAVQDTSVLLGKGVRQWVATVGSLAPDTGYCYELREGMTLLARASFRTAPAADSSAVVRIVAFGDSGGGGADQAAVTRQFATVPFDFMIHMGDIAYEQGTRPEFESKFFQQYDHLLDHVALFPISGNHEYNTEAGGPFREAFVLPENGGPQGRERWYSFDWGPVHLVALDTELVDDAQAAWLDADLSANTRPWVIVYGHRPPFSSGKHGSERSVRQRFVPILEKHRVPLMLSGHEHDYERVLPQNGVTYLVTGGGGRGTRAVGTSSFTAFSEDVLHFVYIAVAGDTLALHAIDAAGFEFDSAVIRRPAATLPAP